MPQAVAVLPPLLMIVAKAVTGLPTTAERLVGRTAAASGEAAPALCGAPTNGNSVRGTFACVQSLKGVTATGQDGSAWVGVVTLKKRLSRKSVVRSVSCRPFGGTFK